jgi:hypothetical protein
MRGRAPGIRSRSDPARPAAGGAPPAGRGAPPRCPGPRPAGRGRVRPRRPRCGRWLPHPREARRRRRPGPASRGRAQADRRRVAVLARLPEPARGLSQPVRLVRQAADEVIAGVQVNVLIAIGVFGGRPAHRSTSQVFARLTRPDIGFAHAARDSYSYGEPQSSSRALGPAALAGLRVAVRPAGVFHRLSPVKQAGQRWPRRANAVSWVVSKG